MNTQHTEADRLIRIADVMHVVGLRKTAVYQLIKDGAFPAPVKVGAASLWSERAVQSWVAQQLQAAAA